MSWIDLTGYLASLAVLATFCMSRMIFLRAVAVLSNVLFVTYGMGEHLYPVLVLHVTLLPINILKIYQLRRQVEQTFLRSPFADINLPRSKFAKGQKRKSFP